MFRLSPVSILSSTTRIFRAGPTRSAGWRLVVDSGPGEGPDPHTHPYSETFIVLEGRGRFRYGDGYVEAQAGEIVVVPPNTVHGFKGLGPGRLRMVTIHAAPAMETAWLEEDDGGEVS